MLDDGRRRLRYLPIEAEPVVQVRFEFTEEHDYLVGALRLKTPKEVLALAVIDRGEDADVVGEAWSAALRGYAELTCVDVPLLVQTGRQPGPGRDRFPGPGNVRNEQRRRGVRSSVGNWSGSTALEPVGSTRAMLASYVVGHRWRLSNGRKASSEAREHARRIGIALGEHETWVKPHSRGIPTDAELVFRWRASG